MKTERTFSIPGQSPESVLEQARRSFMQLGWTIKEASPSCVEGVKSMTFTESRTIVAVSAYPASGGTNMKIGGHLPGGLGPFVRRQLDGVMNQVQVILMERLERLSSTDAVSAAPLSAANPLSPTVTAGPDNEPVPGVDSGPACPRCGTAAAPGATRCGSCGYTA